MDRHYVSNNNLASDSNAELADEVCVCSRQKRFEELVSRYLNELYRFSYWLCRNHSVADDLVQETLLRAWKAMDSLQDEHKVKIWLITILRRENARRFERKQLLLVDIEDTLIKDEKNLLPEQYIASRQVRQAILRLDLEYREPLLMHAIEGYKSKEIAQRLQLNMNTVNTRLFRARHQLRAQLGLENLNLEKSVEPAASVQYTEYSTPFRTF